MNFKNITLHIENAAAVVTINRPDVLNALNAETKQELAFALETLERTPEVRCVILTGAGEKAFCAGADVKELNTLTAASGLDRARAGQRLSLQIEQSGKPVIAAVNGYALGGGCELSLACDIRIASENAKFGQPEVNIGLIPGFGGTQRLPRLIGKGKALEMILTGEMIDAAEALRIGLVQKVVAQAQLLSAAKEIAAKIASKSPLGISLSKKAVNEGLHLNIESGLKLEAQYFSIICGTEDKTEGTLAFLEKRKPNFTGR